MPFTWSFANLTNPHISVVGITGAGKSFFVKTFLIRASYVWNTNAIIIDWAGEYKAWVKQSGGITVSLGKGDYLNIMDLSGMKPLDRSKQILTSLEILTDISDYPEQKRLTDEAIEQAYVNSGFSPVEIAPAGQGRADAEGRDKPPRGEAPGGHVPVPRRAGERGLQAQAVRAGGRGLLRKEEHARPRQAHNVGPGRHRPLQPPGREVQGACRAVHTADAEGEDEDGGLERVEGPEGAGRARRGVEGRERREERRRSP